MVAWALVHIPQQPLCRLGHATLDPTDTIHHTSVGKLSVMICFLVYMMGGLMGNLAFQQYTEGTTPTATTT